MNYEIEEVGKFREIHIIGDVDNEFSRRRLDDDISAAIEKGNHFFVFNLDRTTYLDSAGISIFIHCLCDIQENKGSIYIIARDDTVFEVLEMTGINRLIKTYRQKDDFIKDQKVIAQ